MTDFICGVLAGCSQVIVGHPLDTIKVLLQNNQPWKTSNPLSLYRGFSYPLRSSIAFNSTVFSIYERSLKYTNNDWISGSLSGISWFSK